MAEKKQRKDAKMYVRISSKLEEQLDQLADYMGTTKSALITYYVAQGVKLEQSKISLTQKMRDPDNLAKVLQTFGMTPEQFQQITESAAAKG